MSEGVSSEFVGWFYYQLCWSYACNVLLSDSISKSSQVRNSKIAHRVIFTYIVFHLENHTSSTVPVIMSSPVPIWSPPSDRTKRYKRRCKARAQLEEMQQFVMDLLSTSTSIQYIPPGKDSLVDGPKERDYV